MRKSNFTKFINSLEPEEMKEEIDRLYTKFKIVKEYYAMELGSDDDRQKRIDKAKNGISRLYERFRTRSRITKVNTILKEFALISIFEHELAGLYIHHAEEATSHINYYGWTKDAAFNHLVKSFKVAVDLVTTSQSQDQYLDRLIEILRKLHSHSYVQDELQMYFDENLVKLED